MNIVPDYLAINRNLWNERVKAHFSSGFYNVEAFLNGQSSLNDIELDLLGNLKDKSVLHLQCHFGQDTLSLARMGAEVTGVDLSDEAVAKAQELTTRLNLDATFICCDLYELPHHLDKQFDFVFTSYGTIGWLPDMHKWAEIVSTFLRPGGSFIFVEFHPVIWMFDNDLNYIQYSYFKREAIVETEQGTYADRSAEIQLPSVGWNHSIDEVLQSLLDSGLSLSSFKEFDYSPYDIFPDMVEVEKGKFQIARLKGMIPLVYTLKMEKI